MLGPSIRPGVAETGFPHRPRGPGDNPQDNILAGQRGEMDRLYCPFADFVVAAMQAIQVFSVRLAT
jgi:hypothetical protein